MLQQENDARQQQSVASEVGKLDQSLRDTVSQQVTRALSEITNRDHSAQVCPPTAAHFGHPLVNVCLSVLLFVHAGMGLIFRCLAGCSTKQCCGVSSQKTSAGVEHGPAAAHSAARARSALGADAAQQRSSDAAAGASCAAALQCCHC